MENDVMLHSLSWVTVVLWIILFASFLLFLPVKQKVQRKPAGVYLLFISIYAIEIFGFPSSEGFLWGHTLYPFFGRVGHFIFLLCVYIGGMLIVAGWATIRRSYWSPDDSTGFLVSTGIYRFIRHPQYAGLLLVSLGMLFEWMSLTALALFPVLCIQYTCLALQEEVTLEKEFLAQWHSYRKVTGMFFPVFVRRSK